MTAGETVRIGCHGRSQVAPALFAILLCCCAWQRLDADDGAAPPLPQFAVTRLANGNERSPASGVYGITYSPDGRQLATRCADQVVRVWSVAERKQIFAIDKHKDRVHGMAFSPDGKTLATASEGDDPAIRFWDAASGKQSGEARLGTQLVQYLPGGQSLLSVTRDRATQLTLVGVPQSVKPLPFGSPIAVSVDGDVVAVAESHGTRSPRRVLLSFSSGAGSVILNGLSGFPVAAAFSPNKQALAVGALQDEGTVHLWDLRNSGKHAVLSGHTDTVQALTFSPDLRHLATGSWDRTVRIWELASRQPIVQFKGHGDHVCAVAFSPDGRSLASGAAGAGDNSVLIWDVRSALFPARQELSRLEPAAQAELVKQLADEDPTVAYAAVGALLAAPKIGLPLLSKGLRDANQGTGAESIRQLIRQLDDDEFAVREGAHKRLLELRSEADALLRETLTKSPSAEVRYRIERILQKPATTASRLSEADRRWFSRAILTLEYLGGAEARQLLKEITDKPSTEQHVAEAAAALKRLEGK